MTDIKHIELETGVARDGGVLNSVAFRRPVSGDLRNISIAKLGTLDYDEVRKLLPRISLDGLIVEEVDKLSVADMIEIAGELVDFLAPKRRMTEYLPQ